jgi:uncharacterized phage-associated protein
MITAKNVAEYFLMLSQPGFGDYMSNLRLQKLVYYAQGFHLAKYDAPIFADPILAWNYGPVVEDLYFEYKKFRSGVIPLPENPDLSMFTKRQKDLMDDVFLVYGQYTALKLMELTHNELPWKLTERDHVIPRDLMKKYFKTRLRD